MIDTEEKGALRSRVLSLIDQAIPMPWHDVLALKGGPRGIGMERATLELAHLAPELVREYEYRLTDQDVRIAELEAELEDASMTEPDHHLIEENTRLTDENDRLRAEVARLTAALNGSLVEGVPA